MFQNQKIYYYITTKPCIILYKLLMVQIDTFSGKLVVRCATEKLTHAYESRPNTKAFRVMVGWGLFFLDDNMLVRNISLSGKEKEKK